MRSGKGFDKSPEITEVDAELLPPVPLITVFLTMARISSPLAAVAGVLMGCVCFPLHAKTDFNVVGREMAGMLQNSHYARIQFNADLSARILSDYLSDLDPARLYFTQQDIDALEKKYGRRLHELLIKGRCMEPANEIYKVFSQRVAERVDFAKKLLKTGKFRFDSD